MRHIEKGRLDIPDDKRLEEILNVYGVTLRAFKHKVRFKEETVNTRAEIDRYLGLMQDDQLKLILKFLESLLK